MEIVWSSGGSVVKVRSGGQTLLGHDPSQSKGQRNGEFMEGSGKGHWPKMAWQIPFIRASFAASIGGNLAVKWVISLILKNSLESCCVSALSLPLCPLWLPVQRWDLFIPRSAIIWGLRMF